MSRPVGSAGKPSAASMTIAAKNPYRRADRCAGALHTLSVPKLASALAPKRRRHQLQRILARPFGGACDRADLAPGGIDQHRRRHPSGASRHLQALKNFGAAIGIIAQPIDADLPEPSARLFGIAGVDIDRDHLERWPAEFSLERVERRHLLAAGDAPGGP